MPVCAGKDVDFADRAVATLPYLVPLFDGLKYGEGATGSACHVTSQGISFCILHDDVQCLDACSLISQGRYLSLLRMMGEEMVKADVCLSAAQKACLPRSRMGAVIRAGRFLFAQFPALANLLSPLNPLISLYFSFPFARHAPLPNFQYHWRPHHLRILRDNI